MLPRAREAARTAAAAARPTAPSFPAPTSVLAPRARPAAREGRTEPPGFSRDAPAGEAGASCTCRPEQNRRHWQEPAGAVRGLPGAARSFLGARPRPPGAAPALGCARVTLGRTELGVKLCFTSSACIALLRDLDVLHWETCPAGAGNRGSLSQCPQPLTRVIS